MRRYGLVLTAMLLFACGGGEKKIAKLDVGGDATEQDLQADLAEDILEDAQKDLPEDLAPEMLPDVPLDTPEDQIPDVLPDAPPDIPNDILPDLPPDVPEDIYPDVTPDAPEDILPDLPPDVPVDVPQDIPEDICEPDCVGKECGPDGCGGTCGTCPADATCNAQGLCDPDCPVDPDCSEPGATFCNSSQSGYWQCEYKPDGCLGKVFHLCPQGQQCELTTQTCQESCASHPLCEQEGDWFCNDSATGYYLCEEVAPGCLQTQMVSCAPGEMCMMELGCQPQCQSDPECLFFALPQCTDDGTAYIECQEVAPGCLQWSDPIPCDTDEVCQGGVCVVPCVPDCTDKECGPDGCGGECGECGPADTCPLTVCVEGLCELDPECCFSNQDCDDQDSCTIDTCQGGLCQYEWSSEPGCCDPAVYLEDFNTGILGGWAVNNSSPESGWRIGTSQFTSSPYALYFGDATETDYLIETSGTIEWLEWRTLPVASALELSFNLWLDVEANYDGVVVKLVTPTGAVTLDEFDGQSQVWENMTYDLVPYAGMDVKLRFEFESDYLYSFSGVYIDDIQINMDCCQTNDDCNDNNPCTEDTCPGPNSFCNNEWLPDCCLANTDCEDNDPCTVDLCFDLQCLHNDVCCASNEDCNDGDDACTNDYCIDGLCEYEYLDGPGCCQTVLFEDSFESGSLADYAIQDTGGESSWFISVSDAVSGTHSLVFSNVGENGYDNSEEAILMTPEIQISDNPISPSLQFTILWEVENNFDKLLVGVFHGEQVTLLEEFTGNSDGQWLERNYSLSAYAGQAIRIRFLFKSDSSIQSGFGVRIDDLGVLQGCCSLDSDCDDGNPCTTDSCPGLNSVCEHTPVPDCCQTDANCDDGDDCTTDTCTFEYVCEHFNECCDTDEECDNGDPCTQDLCTDGWCQHEPTGLEGCCESALLWDDFSSDKDWVYQTWWERGPAMVSTCAWQNFNEDPGADHTASSDNYLAGVVIGGCVGQSTPDDGPYSLVSPPIDTTGLDTLYLSYWRFLNSDGGSFMESTVEVFDGLFWHELWGISGQSHVDEEWTFMSHDLSGWLGGTIRVRFTVEKGTSQVWSSPSWSVDDVRVSQSLEDWCCLFDSDCTGLGEACVSGRCQ